MKIEDIVMEAAPGWLTRNIKDRAQSMVPGFAGANTTGIEGKAKVELNRKYAAIWKAFVTWMTQAGLGCKKKEKETVNLDPTTRNPATGWAGSPGLLEEADNQPAPPGTLTGAAIAKRFPEKEMIEALKRNNVKPDSTFGITQDLAKAIVWTYTQILVSGEEIKTDNPLQDPQLLGFLKTAKPEDLEAIEEKLHTMIHLTEGKKPKTKKAKKIKKTIDEAPAAPIPVTLESILEKLSSFNPDQAQKMLDYIERLKKTAKPSSAASDVYKRQIKIS